MSDQPTPPHRGRGRSGQPRQPGRSPRSISDAPGARVLWLPFLALLYLLVSLLWLPTRILASLPIFDPWDQFLRRLLARISNLMDGLLRLAETDCAADPPRFYNGARKTAPAGERLIGFSAKITTRPTTLPCEPVATFVAFSRAWTGISEADSFGGEPARWAQMGYLRFREEGKSDARDAIYVESVADYSVQSTDPTVVEMRIFRPPAAGQHIYEGQLDQGSGEWVFTYDGTRLHAWTHEKWKGGAGRRAEYTAEIYDRTSQMVGTAAEPCRFEACKYRVVGGTGFTDAGLERGDLKSDDDAEWGNRFVDATTIEVWDVNP